jgi:hypothetical protein
LVGLGCFWFVLFLGCVLFGVFCKIGCASSVVVGGKLMSLCGLF